MKVFRTLERKNSVKTGIKRLIFVALSFIMETAFIVMMFTRLAHYAEIINICFHILGATIVLGIYSMNKTSSMKMPWIILILALPILGTCIYLTIGLNGAPGLMRKRYATVDSKIMPSLEFDSDAIDSLKSANPNAYSISSYIYHYSNYPIYKNSGIQYYNNASLAYESLLNDLKEAKSFIFMEYFAIENSIAWKRCEDILVEKVKEGVEVRVFYDDIGSIGYVNLDFARYLESKGIKCKVFNPCGVGIKLILNHRDHRKITIIDGKTAYTGGFNIADEYFEITNPYGHWKDTGIRITGEPVRSFVIMFLEMWLFERKRKQSVIINPETDINPYLVSFDKNDDICGYLQPYADTPLDNENLAEEVYISIINKANSYCYFITPYLIISDEMLHAISLASKRGVDVRIITPGIPDKKLIYSVTRSFYNALAKNGVRIYEWTPGFSHAKMCVSDDRMATVGTINLDYRSLYHHFEDGCLIIDSDVIKEIKSDFISTFSESREVTDKYKTGRSSFLRLGQLILRLFAELL